MILFYPLWYNISMARYTCKVCGKEVIRKPCEVGKTGDVYCSHECYNTILRGETNPNFNNHWAEELRQSQSVTLKATFRNGRKTWNKGLTKVDDPRLAKCGVIGNDNGKYSKGSKRPDNIWRNLFNSAGVRFGLQKIHKYKYHAKFWLILRDEVLKRDNNQCQLCGKTGDLIIHHKIPVKMGGKDDIDNLITLCRICHGIEEVKARERNYVGRRGHRKNW